MNNNEKPIWNGSTVLEDWLTSWYKHEPFKVVGDGFWGELEYSLESIKEGGHNESWAETLESRPNYSK